MAPRKKKEPKAGELTVEQKEAILTSPSLGFPGVIEGFLSREDPETEVAEFSNLRTPITNILFIELQKYQIANPSSPYGAVDPKTLSVEGNPQKHPDAVIKKLDKLKKSIIEEAAEGLTDDSSSKYYFDDTGQGLPGFGGYPEQVRLERLAKDDLKELLKEFKRAYIQKGPGTRYPAEPAVGAEAEAGAVAPPPATAAPAAEPPPAAAVPPPVAEVAAPPPPVAAPAVIFSLGLTPPTVEPPASPAPPPVAAPTATVAPPAAPTVPPAAAAPPAVEPAAPSAPAAAPPVATTPPPAAAPATPIYQLAAVQVPANLALPDGETLIRPHKYDNFSPFNVQFQTALASLTDENSKPRFITSLGQYGIDGRHGEAFEATLNAFKASPPALAADASPADVIAKLNTQLEAERAKTGIARVTAPNPTSLEQSRQMALADPSQTAVPLITITPGAAPAVAPEAPAPAAPATETAPPAPTPAADTVSLGLGRKANDFNLVLQDVQAEAAGLRSNYMAIGGTRFTIPGADAVIELGGDSSSTFTLPPLTAGVDLGRPATPPTPASTPEGKGH